MLSGFSLLLIVRCEKREKELVNKKKQVLNGLENYQFFQMAKETKIKKWLPSGFQIQKNWSKNEAKGMTVNYFLKDLRNIKVDTPEYCSVTQQVS